MEKLYPDIAPIVKWAGGKRQLLDVIMPLIPEFETYYEPFAGGGAVFFRLQPQRAVINDSNRELMNVYRVVREQPEELIALLQEHSEKNSREYFYQIRSQDRSLEAYMAMSDLQRAARIIYLNKTCFNGLFRVNRAGEFNTPWGRYRNPNIVNADSIRAMSHYLREADILLLSEDYRESFKGIGADAFVYLDPPYMPISASASFTGYTAAGFGPQQQKELKKQCDLLNRRGVRFLLSNSCCPFIEELYRDYIIDRVPARRAVNAKGDRRGAVDELLIRNYRL